jgi:hypothetical protein
MERKTRPAKFVAYSNKTHSILLDLGAGEVWWPVTEPVAKFISKVTKGEVEIEQDTNSGEILYIKNIGGSIPASELQSADKQFSQATGLNDRNNSIEAQVVLKAATEISKAQIESADKNSTISPTVYMEINIELCARMLKLAKTLI